MPSNLDSSTGLSRYPVAPFANAFFEHIQIHQMHLV